MKKLFLYLTLFTLPVLIAGCKKQKEADLKSIMTAESGDTMPTAAKDSATLSPTTVGSTDSQHVGNTSEEDTANKSITEKTKNFTKDKAKLSFPYLDGISSKNKSAINTMIEDNAKLALSNFSSNPDSDIDINYNIKNQSRNRLSIVYTGTVKNGNDTSKIIFTNNINLDTGKSIGLSDFADPLTVAGYILSNDLLLENAGNTQAAGFNEYKKTLTVDTLKALLEDADFPVVKNNDTNEGFPKIFSYESGGDIFICIPVSHELGDYVIAKYSPSTK